MKPYDRSQRRGLVKLLRPLLTTTTWSWTDGGVDQATIPVIVA
jgi:hypothetical protein